MASINLNEETNIKITMAKESSINAQLQDINYIPGYQVAEEERRKNELERIANENERETYYADIQQRVANGEFNGKDGKDGAVGYDGKSLEYNWNGTELGVRLEGETEFAYTDLKGEQGERGLQGEKGERGEQGIQGSPGEKGAQGEKGEQGEKGIQGETGDSGVYIGTEEPIDANVWIDPSGEAEEMITKEYVDTAIASAIGGALNGSY